MFEDKVQKMANEPNGKEVIKDYQKKGTIRSIIVCNLLLYWRHI
jgi:hypothetical protein